MIHPPSAYEALQSGSRRRLFSLFGVPWTVTSESWQFITSRLVFGILLALIFMSGHSLIDRILWGLAFGMLVGASNFIHILGHLIGGKLVNAPMDENLITQYSVLTAYHEDPSEVPGRVHLTRAAAGPLMTLLAGFLSLAGWGLLGGPALAFMAVLNLLLFVQVSLPIPNADGEVIWRELRRLRDKK